jgi:hypothetical protein
VKIATMIIIFFIIQGLGKKQIRKKYEKSMLKALETMIDLYGKAFFFKAK